MAAELSPEEEQATKQFLEEINKWTVQYNVSPLSWNVAVKFLMARKFDVLRAIELFHSYRETRLKEGIVKLKPHEEPLRSELLSGKFTILNARDPSGASIALFTAKLHHPSKSVQHVVLQALFYLLDRAVESFETQRNGLVFIYDMAGSHYTNFELDLSKKILNLLKGAFPARLKKVFIVGAPMWFRVPYSIISLLLKEKLRERVQMVKMSELKEHLPRECLPEYLGGSLKLDPLSWNCRFLPQQNGHPDPLDELILVPLASPRDNGSVHVPGPKCMTVHQLMDHVNRKQKRGIYEEYEDIRRRSPAGTFSCSLAPYNQEKNRYGDVPCLDQTRVKLTKQYSRSELTDYINASFMDGYKQRNAYIGTQGPLENTYGDFWRMVWEQNVLVIVMTTRYLLRAGHLPLPAPGHGHAECVPDGDADENAASFQHPDPGAVLLLLHGHPRARSERGPAPPCSHTARPGEELMRPKPDPTAGTGSPVRHDQPAFLTPGPDSAEPSATKFLRRKAPVDHSLASWF
ncbi:tyrosine-protein phosphatase non-receptor type 9 isoform X2 [Carettochelys insculpta]|uniref:tyrosine-protein phosphatase non-receptor type 9 isoform X2 n=1 Tax=Carettochelys insculpta TaxID=44489 RepID=UPI003EBEBAEB